MSSSDDADEIQLLREHRDLLERLAESDLPISEDAKRGLTRLENDGDRHE